MYCFGSQKNLPPQNRFSIATAQEYTEMVRKSIDHHRSRSKSSQRGVLSPKVPALGMGLPGGEIKPLRHLKLRQKIGERSRSNSNRDSIDDSRSSSRQQLTASEVKNGLRVSIASNKDKPQSDKIVEFDQNNLLSSLERQNSELVSQISKAESKQKVIEKSIKQQKNSHFMQKQLYQQQLAKLRQTLELQMSSREIHKSSSQDCSLGDQLRINLSSSTNEFLQMTLQD